MTETAPLSGLAILFHGQPDCDANEMLQLGHSEKKSKYQSRREIESDLSAVTEEPAHDPNQTDLKPWASALGAGPGPTEGCIGRTIILLDRIPHSCDSFGDTCEAIHDEQSMLWICARVNARKFLVASLPSCHAWPCSRMGPHSH
jgi:hypothetical protein